MLRLDPSPVRAAEFCGDALQLQTRPTVQGGEGEQTHGEVSAVEFELLPHADEQAQVEVVQHQVNAHVPIPAGLQQVAEQLHVAEAVHHDGHRLCTDANLC